MNRRFFAIMLGAAMISLSIAGCSSGGDTKPAETTTTESTTEPLPALNLPDKIYGYKSKCFFDTTGGDTGYMDKLIEAGKAPDYYRGTYINYDDEANELCIYFLNNNPDQSVKVYDFTDEVPDTAE